MDTSPLGDVKPVRPMKIVIDTGNGVAGGLGTALSGDASLDGFLAWTDRPWVKASEVAVVALLAAHLTGGLRLLFIEFVGWQRGSQGILLAAAGGAAACCALAFALNLF